MKLNRSLKLIIFTAGLIFLFLMPVSLSTEYQLILGNRIIRANVLGFMFALIFICFIEFISRIYYFKRIIRFNNYEKIYLVFLFYTIMISLFKGFNQTSFIFFQFVDSLLVIGLPFFAYKVIIKQSSLYKEIKNITIIIGILISLQVVLFAISYSFFGKLLGWSINEFEIYDGIMRARTTVGAATVTGLFLFLIFTLTFLEYQTKPRIFYKAASFFIVCALVLTITRSAVLLLVIFILWYLQYYFFRNNYKKVLRIMISGVLLVILGSSLLPSVADNMYSRFFTERSMGSNTTRIELVTKPFEKIKNNLLLGTGLGYGFSRYNDLERIDNLSNPHNQHIALILETGIIGYVIFLFFYLSVYYHFKKYFKNSIYIKGTMISISLLFFIGGQFETFYTADLRTSMLMWLGISFMELEKQNIEGNTNTELDKS